MTDPSDPLPRVFDIAENRREVLSKSEQTNDIDITTSVEIEPSTRKPLNAAGAQVRNATELADTQGSGARNTSDHAKRIDSRPEEPLTQIIATNIAVVPNPINQIRLSERPQPNFGHKAEPSARSRSSSTTSPVN